MKIYSLLLFLTILSLSCIRKNDDVDHRLDPEVVRYLPMAKPRSYWIYHNTKLNRRDSVFAAEFYNGTPPCRSKDCETYETIVSEYQGSGNCWISMMADSRTSDNHTQVVISSYAGTTPLSTFILGRRNNQFYVTDGTVDILPSIRINNVTYNDVLRLINSNHDSVFISPKAGILKANMECVGNIELVKYKMIQ